MTTLPTLDAIPAVLRARPQWVCWRYEARDEHGKTTKVPYQAQYPSRKASSNGPNTWASVELALQTAEKYKFDGIGYVFAPDDPYAGFDLDDILDDDGNVAEWAARWLEQLPTYTEISPSGHGVKGIVIGKLPGGGVNAGSVEVYDQGRYFTITGRRLEGVPLEPQPVNGALDRLYAYAQELKAKHEDEREQRRKRAYAERALLEETDRVRHAAEGTRNDALNRAAFSLAQFVAAGVLTETEVVEALSDAAGRNGLGAQEIRSTIRSGMKAGAAEPRIIPPPKDAPVAGEIVSAAEAPAAKAVGPRRALEPMTGDELLAADIAPVRIFVPSLIRAGLSFFIGQPGVGKTPALVQLAIALSTGGMWLGAFRVPKMRVAYIGPEYDRGDIRGIIIASIGKDTVLPDLLIFTVENFVGPESEAEALEMIDDLVFKFGVEAIVIDLFTGFLPPEKFKPNAYRGDYREFLAYHRKALEHQIMICGAWHGTKRDSNPSTMYNGGQGFWGAAGGGRLVMFQDEEDQVKLYGQLRGNKAITYTMTESKVNGRHFWAVVEGADGPEPSFGSDVHRAIWKVVRQHGGPGNPLQPSVIASIIKSDHPEVQAGINYVRRACSILAKRGVLRQFAGGYSIPKDSDHRDQDDQSVQSDHDDQDDRSVQDGELGDHRDRLTDPPMIAPAPRPSAANDKPIIPIIDSRVHAPLDTDDDFWFAVPPVKRSIIRLYLKSDRPQDEARARELCDEYALEYDEARRMAREGK